MTPYADRTAAGHALARHLGHPAWSEGDEVVVLALPRGGVPVAVPVARSLHAPLDVVVVRKLGVPGRPELAMGAVAAVAGELQVVRNPRVLEALHLDEDAFERVLRRETDELRRRETAYRHGRPAVAVRGRAVVLVDDGLATGASMRAALLAVRQQQPARVVVAVPIGAADTCAELRRLADDVVCPWTPATFVAVGQGYVDFRPVTDRQVRADLARG